MVVSQSLIYTPKVMGGKLASSGLIKQINSSVERPENQQKSEQTQSHISSKKLPPQVPVDKDGSKGTPQINTIKKKVGESNTKKFQKEKFMPYAQGNRQKHNAPLPTGQTGSALFAQGASQRPNRNQVVILRNRSHNAATHDENEPNSDRNSIKMVNQYRERSLNAERRPQSPLKLSLQHGPISGSQIKTPSVHNEHSEIKGAGNAMNWTSEVKAMISKISTRNMRTN